MSQQLPVTVDFATLPNTGAGYTPQELADRLSLNARVFTEQSFALFTTGAVAPTSDTGPWAKNGNTWYYWDSVSGAYIPFIIQDASLKYWVGAVSPDPTIYLFWIELDGGGSPLALKTYFGGAWVDVYATTIAGYSTTAAMNAAIAAALTAYSTTVAMTAAIAAAAFQSYPAQATMTAPQTIDIDVAPHKVTLDSDPINPGVSPWSVINYRYTAPVTGIYLVNCTTQFDDSTGVQASTDIQLHAYVNGINSGTGSGNGPTYSASTTQWFPGFSGMLSLTAGQYVELYATIQDGTNTGAITLTTADFSVHRIL